MLQNTEDRYLIEYPAETVEPKLIEPLPIAFVADAEMKPDIVPQPLPQIAGPHPGIAPATSTLPRHDLPVEQFMKQCELLIANNRENSNEDTAEDVRTIVRIFCGILGEHNVASSSGIDQTHLAALRQHFD